MSKYLIYSSLDTQLKFHKIAVTYKDFALKFNNTVKDETSYLLSLKDIPSDYNEDSSNMLGAYYNSSEYPQ
ncbi:hypothetical protein RAS_00530 [Rickettsia asiatica]|uniref:Uncharacterized protein n=1 Tax=Rickettsia asiatica TaxID=238800 RepID=A0A510G8R6_9RICK|nr:hypothetical protein [Rickettsia asiatica]BBJ30944.1 hypothetical protein RAS_00530 [Rickettsia asiatica]